jgi:hypothetical protein
MSGLSGKTSQNDQDNVLEITDRTVHASLEVLDRIPDYMAADLVGMVMEAEFELFAMDEQKPVSWGMLRKRLKDPSEEIFRLVILKTLLVLLCYKRRTQQTGQQGSCWSRNLASLIRSVAIEYGLCRSARTRRAARPEVGWNFLGA